MFLRLCTEQRRFHKNKVVTIVERDNEESARGNSMAIKWSGFLRAVQKVTQPMVYLESVFPGHLIKEILASTILGLKPPRLLFMGASQGYCVFKSSTHTVRASGQHSALCGQDINWHIAKHVR
jgi:hypothetical protein